MICQVCHFDIALAFNQLCGPAASGRLRGRSTSKEIETRGHSNDWLSFSNSVSLGCHICSILCANLTSQWPGKVHKVKPDPTSELDAVQYRFRFFRHENEFELTDLGGMAMTSTVASSLSVSNPAKPSDIKRCSEKFSLVPFMDRVDNLKGISNTGDADAWKAAKSWIEECLLDHDECKTHSDAGTTYPRRLLDLGMKDQSLTKLVDTSSEQINEPYVTLSHSWKGKSPLKLTRETLPHMIESVPVYSLPSTFREAVDVSRRLGARYLWIDALCIIQDDAEDRCEQIPTMSSVYSNSLCTIAAMASQDPSGGLFRNRRNIHAAPAVLTIEAPENHAGIYAVYSRSDIKSFQREHLRTRAWAFQERLLSKRILAFGTNGIHWECKSSTVNHRSEGYPQGTLVAGMLESFFYIFTCMGWTRLNQATVERGERSIRTWWKLCVEQYSACQLTDPEDRLAAFSGICKKFRADLGSEYLAGLWKEWLPYDMCWVSSKPGGHPKNYVAPSWSWASVSEELSSYSWNEAVKDHRDPDDYSKPMVELLDYEIVPVGDDPMGRLVSAWMCISGFVLPISSQFVQEIQEGCQILDESLKGREIKIHWDYVNGHSSTEQKMFLLPLIEYQGDPSNLYITKGIVLEADPSSGDGFFRRIGAFTADIAGDNWFEISSWSLKNDRTLRKLESTLSSNRQVSREPEPTFMGKRDEGDDGWRQLELKTRQAQTIILV